MTYFLEGDGKPHVGPKSDITLREGYSDFGRDSRGNVQALLEKRMICLEQTHHS